MVQRQTECRMVSGHSLRRRFNMIAYSFTVFFRLFLVLSYFFILFIGEMSLVYDVMQCEMVHCIELRDQHVLLITKDDEFSSMSSAC